MEASIVDLRYKTKDILRAIERNETVTILYRGKPKAIIQPIPEKRKKKKERITDDPLFGILKGEQKPVEEIMKELRGGRYRDL